MNPTIDINNIHLCNCEECKRDGVVISIQLCVEIPRYKLYEVIKAIDYLGNHWAEDRDWTVTLEQEKPKKISGTEVLYQELNLKEPH